MLLKISPHLLVPAKNLRDEPAGPLDIGMK
jgi:hypothetical protein